ncbi:unnamed protein product, partial [marine sediment metagenome]
MTTEGERIFLTGGAGRLGRELRDLLPGIIAPSEAEVDVTRPDDIDRALDAAAPDVFVHAAAFTDVSGAESHRGLCWKV